MLINAGPGDQFPFYQDMCASSVEKEDVGPLCHHLDVFTVDAGLARPSLLLKLSRPLLCRFLPRFLWINHLYR